DLIRAISSLPTAPVRPAYRPACPVPAAVAPARSAAVQRRPDRHLCQPSAPGSADHWPAATMTSTDQWAGLAEAAGAVWSNCSKRTWSSRFLLLRASSGASESFVKQIVKIARNPSAQVGDSEQCPAGISESRAY